MSKIEAFLERAGNILEEQIRPMLRGTCHMSLIIRTPGAPEKDIFLSGDPDFEEVVKVLERLRDMPVVAERGGDKP